METLFEIYDCCLEYLSNIINKSSSSTESDWLLTYRNSFQEQIEKIAEECDAEVAENKRWNDKLHIGSIRLPIVDTSNYDQVKFAWQQQFGTLAYSIRRVYNCNKVAKKYGFDEKRFELILEDLYKNDDPEPFFDYVKYKMMYNEVYEKCDALYLQLIKIDCIRNDLPAIDDSDYNKLYFAYTIADRLNKATNFLNSSHLFEKKNAEKIDAVIKKYLDKGFKPDSSYKPIPIPAAPANEEISFPKSALIGGGCGAILGLGLGLLCQIPILTIPVAGIGILVSSIIRSKKNKSIREVYNKKLSVYNKEKSEIEAKNKAAYDKMKQKYYDKFSRTLLTEVEKDLENLTFVLQSLTVACMKILNLPIFNFLPEKYKYSATVLETFVEYYNDKRVTTIQDAVNLYISESRENEHRQEMLRLEQIRIEEQQKAIIKQQKKDEERNRLLKQMTQVINELEKNEREAEKQHQKNVDDLKESLSDAKKQVKETKDTLTNLQRETDDLKRMLKD